MWPPQSGGPGDSKGPDALDWASKRSTPLGVGGRELEGMLGNGGAGSSPRGRFWPSVVDWSGEQGEEAGADRSASPSQHAMASLGTGGEDMGGMGFRRPQPGAGPGGAREMAATNQTAGLRQMSDDLASIVSRLESEAS